MKKFQDYINKFSHGNMDLSGGLTSSWVSSSLKISPEEYIEFLTQLVNRKLFISDASYKKQKRSCMFRNFPEDEIVWKNR
jgi:beta-lactamase class D